MKRTHSLKWIFLTCLIIFNQSCTDLDEDIYSQVTEENFLQSDEEFSSVLGAAYSRLYDYAGSGTLLPLQEVTSDEMIVPIRGGSDWEDGGVWRGLKEHTYTFENDRVTGGWNFCFGGVNDCNRLIYQFEQSNSNSADQFIAELKVLRALFYWWLLDLYGNVPIVTQFDVPTGFLPSMSSREEVYSFVEDELSSNMEKLSKAVDASTYGRMNYYTAQAILAKLYLNAEVYTGKPQWEKAAAACDIIINSENYNLTPNFFDNFTTNNSNSTEFIFAIPYDKIYATGFVIPFMTLHYGSQDTYNLTAQPWNGFCTVQEFYESFEDNDVRKNSFLVGPQFKSNGEPVTDPAFEPTDPDGPQVNYTPELPGGFRTIRQAGARIGKWEIEMGSTGNLSNDFAIFRYADILLMKAEALFRQGDTGGEALRLVNLVRERAGVEPFSVLTEEDLLAERGRELFSEVYRRQDLIRFGKYNDAWQFKPVSPPHVKIFPIPRAQLDANPNLNQNPGY